jgi:DNA-binding NarL/FixJ family response regulator
MVTGDLYDAGAVARGEAIFGPSVAARLTAFLSSTTDAAPAFPELTAREREILDLVARNLTSPQIAARLGLSATTVRNHVSNVFAKLQVADRAQAGALARHAGLGGVARSEA